MTLLVVVVGLVVLAVVFVSVVDGFVVPAVVVFNLMSRLLQVWQQSFLCRDEQGTSLVSRSVQIAQSP